MKTHLPPLLRRLWLLLAAGVFCTALNAQCTYNPAIVINDTVIQPCNSDGAITLTVNGGTAPYTFSWSNTNYGTAFSTSQNLTGLIPGYYNVRVTDANGTCNEQWTLLSEPFHLTSTTEPDSCPLHNGKASINVSGGTLPYTYLWSNGAITSTISGLTGGSYDVTVTDASGCVMVGGQSDSMNAIVVGSVNNMILQTTTAPATCQPNSGTAAVSVSSGGTAPYTYQWSDSWQGLPNPAWTTSAISGLAGNTSYYVTVTDASGCYSVQYLYVDYNSPITLSATHTSENCNHADGTALAVASGNATPLTYVWSTGATTAQITGLTADTYAVTVKDANNCVNTTTVIVDRYSPIHANIARVDEVCDNNMGTLTSNPTLGTAPYSYSWSNGAHTAAITNLSEGNYYLVVFDAAGCSTSTGSYIQNKSSITPNETHTDATCGGAGGSINLAPTGGATPYNYQWSSGQTTSSISSLPQGSYYCTITEAQGCTVLVGVYIQLNSGFSAYAYTTADELCQTQSGVANVYASGSGTFNYQWSNGQTGNTATGLAAGVYTVTVTSTNGCSVVKAGFVNRISDMAAFINVTPATCIFTNDGAASVSVSGGTPPYTYQWGNGSTTSTATNLNAEWGMGVYVQDANGCATSSYVNSIGYNSISCAAIIEGTVVDDINADCLLNSGDGFLHNTVVRCAPDYYRCTDNLGRYRFVVPAGNYGVTQYAEFRNQACPVGSIALNGCVAGTVYDNNDFYDQPLNVEDLRVSFESITPPRPGFSHIIRLHCFNEGLRDVSGTVDFVYDANVNYMGGFGSVNTTTHTITIPFTLDAAGGWTVVDMQFSTPTTTPLGTLQNYSAHITPDGNDATPLNNTETEQMEVVGAYDPNDKHVSPRGHGAPGYITTNDSLLKYTIRFQNTGVYSASFVAIKDTLDENLDITTVKGGAASHPYRIQIMDKRTLVFLFDPIYLPDSSVDDSASHGMVTFYVKQKKNLPVGTQLRNSASIYFDFNEPVKTNTTLNTIGEPSGINTPEANMRMQLMPNPSAGNTMLQLQLNNNWNGTLAMYDLLGNIVLQQQVNAIAGSQNIFLNTEHLPQGLYTVKMIGTNTAGSIKFVKH